VGSAFLLESRSARLALDAQYEGCGSQSTALSKNYGTVSYSSLILPLSSELSVTGFPPHNGLIKAQPKRLIAGFTGFTDDTSYIGVSLNKASKRFPAPFKAGQKGGFADRVSLVFGLCPSRCAETGVRAILPLEMKHEPIPGSFRSTKSTER
jgi:hypothetical protein